MTKVNFKKVDVDGFNVFYREAGPVDAPALLLLHGFPSSSLTSHSGVTCSALSVVIRGCQRPPLHRAGEAAIRRGAHPRA